MMTVKSVKFISDEMDQKHESIFTNDVKHGTRGCDIFYFSFSFEILLLTDTNKDGCLFFTALINILAILTNHLVTIYWL